MGAQSRLRLSLSLPLAFVHSVRPFGPPKADMECASKTVPFTRRLFLEAARPEPSSLEEYTACVENKNSLVVSEVFCLPHDYRKDVPPPSEY